MAADWMVGAVALRCNPRLWKHPFDRNEGRAFAQPKAGLGIAKWRRACFAAILGTGMPASRDSFMPMQRSSDVMSRKPS